MAVITPEILEEKLKEGSKKRLVCFVCVGNTCRSPMAAAVFNHIARILPVCSMCDMEKIINAKHVRAISAGISDVGCPIAGNACRALEEAGIPSLPDNDYRSHESRRITDELAEACELIVCVNAYVAMEVTARFPLYASKIICMSEDIPDPFGGTIETYRSCLSIIQHCVEEVYENL